MRRIERIFSHARRIPFDAYRDFPHETVHPRTPLGEFGGGRPSSLREVKKRGEKGRRVVETEREGNRKKRKKKLHAKWKAVSEPLREEPCFLLISLIDRFLSYMAVCLTNLMVFFPLPESWMAVTPATLAIFWSQYGNGNRQP